MSLSRQSIALVLKTR